MKFFDHRESFKVLIIKKAIFAVLFCALGNPCLGEGAIVADYRSVNQFSEIPEEWFAVIRDQFGTEYPHEIFFGTRSHGSQLLWGIEMLEGISEDLFLQPGVHVQTGLAGQYDDEGIFWTDATRQRLIEYPETKIVIWAMCRTITGVLSEEEIWEYLLDMEQLENEYPGVRFVYWTDVIDEAGESGIVEQRNNLIRNYCLEEDKILFDFADITARNPNGTYFPGTTEGGCTWCNDWCTNAGFAFCDNCVHCPHSVCFDCLRKGQAFWWLLARMAGWEGSGITEASNTPKIVFHGMWPNPFNPSIEIAYYLPQNAHVKVVVYDARGAEVSLLFEGYQNSGENSIIWDGRNSRGDRQASGSYIFSINLGGQVFSKKATLLK